MSYGNWASSEMRREILEGVCVVIGLASARDTLADVTVVPLAGPVSPIPVTVAWRADETRTDLWAFVELARSIADAIVDPWRLGTSHRH